MKRLTVSRAGAFLLTAAVSFFPAVVTAKAPPGADLVDVAYSSSQGMAVLSRFELFRSDNGKDWAPAGFSDRAVRLTAVALGKGITLVASEPGTIYRSVDGGPFQAVKAPRDPFGRTVTGIRTIAVHPTDEEIMASSGQGLLVSRDKGATWEAINDPFWKNPDAREVIAVGYAGKNPLVVTRKGVYRRSEGGFEPLTKGLPESFRPTVASVSEGQILMAIPGEGLYLATRDSKFSKLKGAPGDPIAFVGFADDAYLAARPTTVLHKGDTKGREWIPVGQYSPSFIPVDSVSTPFGDFLILRGKGLVRLDGDRFVPVEMPLELSMVNARLTVQGAQLAGTQGGVYRSTSAGREWQDVTPEDLGVGVNVFLPLENDRILLGSDGAGVFMSGDAGKSWRNWSLRLGTSNTIKGLASYNGGVLAATENGLMWTEASEDPNWRSLDGGIGRNSIIAMVHEGGRYWLATQSGVYTAGDGENFVPVKGIEGRVNSISVENGNLLSLVNCRVVLVEKSGNIKEFKNFSRCTASAVALVKGEVYAGTDDGLYRWGDGDWVRIGTRQFPVAGLHREEGSLRVVTRGAGTYMAP